MEKEKLNHLIDRFLELNSKDPNKIEFEKQEFPREYIYSKWLSKWVHQLIPNPSIALQLASYSQHLKRWEIPRDSFPKDRNGYLKWRTKLYKYHSDEVEKILKEEKVNDDLILEVKSIIEKKNSDTNKDVQLMEDALCLVTLEFQIEEFSKSYSDEKMKDILQKIIKKMSQKGIEEALKLNYSLRVKNLLLSLIN